MKSTPKEIRLQWNKLTTLNKKPSKASYSSNLKSNRENWKLNWRKEAKEFNNNSSSSMVILSSIESNNKTNTYVSDHIKRMLNASINWSNPSISAHRNKSKVLVANQTRDMQFGFSGYTSKNQSNKRLYNFNNTQKINLDSELEFIGTEEKEDGKIQIEKHAEDFKNKMISSKFRLMISNQNRENLKWLSSDKEKQPIEEKNSQIKLLVTIQDHWILRLLSRIRFNHQVRKAILIIKLWIRKNIQNAK